MGQASQHRSSQLLMQCDAKGFGQRPREIRDRCCYSYSLARDAIYLKMSNQQGNYADRVPLSKRQKYGGGDEEAVGGPMYDEATARKMLKEVVRVSAEYGEEAVIGFDPNDAALDDPYYIDVDVDGYLDTTPLIYFALKGDMKMCRIKRGHKNVLNLVAQVRRGPWWSP